MNKQEYDQIQRHLLLQAQTIHALFDNLDEFIAAIEKADAAGPVMDPSLWQEGHEKMDRIKTIAKAINKAKKEVKPALDYLRKHQDT